MFFIDQHERCEGDSSIFSILARMRDVSEPDEEWIERLAEIALVGESWGPLR